MISGSEWDVYLCKVKGNPASILLDLSLRKSTPDPHRPWLLIVWIKLLEPTDDGLSSGSEFDSLLNLEKSICAEVEKDCCAVLAGSITNVGRRELYFYGAADTNFQISVARALTAMREYEFHVGTRHDPSWTFYLDVLYPSESELERMANRRVLDALTRAGDQHYEIRPVQHWIFFRNPEDRDSFVQDVVGKGYDEPCCYEIQEHDERYCACVSRDQSVEPEEIDRTVQQLREIAEHHSGNYDGWETQVTSDSPTLPPTKPN